MAFLQEIRLLNDSSVTKKKGGEKGELVRVKGEKVKGEKVKGETYFQVQ